MYEPQVNDKIIINGKFSLTVTATYDDDPAIDVDGFQFTGNNQPYDMMPFSEEMFPAGIERLLVAVGGRIIRNGKTLLVGKNRKIRQL